MRLFRAVHRRGGIATIATLATLLTAPAAFAQATITAQVSSSTAGQPMAPGFVGVSLEYSAVHHYTGRNPGAINPALVPLLRALAPGQQPVLRIGGNSTDHTWWPVRGVIPPGGVDYTLTPNWLRTTRALAAALNARLIMGINLATARPALAATEARALLQGIGQPYVAALEIGNEPDLYGSFVWYRNRHGRLVSARPHNWNLGSYIVDFSHWRAALPNAPVAGPAFAGLDWMSGLNEFLSHEPGLGLVTFHRYPLRGCIHKPDEVGYPTIPALLSDASSAGLAAQVAPYVSIAHGDGVPFRLDELNSVACRGRRGVSDTFASALWVLDTLFNLASVGVDGVNVHTLPGAAYELFTVTHSAGHWHTFVHPEYYGMTTFALAFPPGAQLLSVSAPSGPVKVWATRATNGTVRVTLINKDSANDYNVQLSLPGAPTAATGELMHAPTVASKNGVSFSSTPVAHTGIGPYAVNLPPGSAVVVTK